MSNQPEKIKIENVSDTALWVASFRATESCRPDALFKDRFASLLIGEEGKKKGIQIPYADHMYWVLVVRTVAIDRLVESALKHGVDTVINLGAGLDTRPYRMDLPSDLRWIEVDFPNLIELKNEKLRDEKPVCRLERVALDLTKRNQFRSFLANISEGAKSVLVITEGVIMYLSSEEAGFLAEDLSAHPKIQYWIQDFHNMTLLKWINFKFRSHLKASPLKFKGDWFPFFANYGWTPEETVYMDDEGKRIGRQRPFLFWRQLRQWTYTLFVLGTLRAPTGFALFKRN